MQGGLFTYAWDLAAEGYDPALGRIAGKGFTSIHLACAYHTGKLLLPHNPRQKVRFLEDGALYFQPDLSRYGRLQPRISELAAGNHDPLADLDRARRSHGLSAVAWTVCLHNTWLGERYPECAIQNAFGDPYIHSLSPAHPDVREYLVALTGDIVAHAELEAIELESPGYMGFYHDYHHEIIGLPLDDTQQTLLGISFTPHETERAREAGVDAERLRQAVADALVGIWETAPATDEREQAESTARAIIEGQDLAAYRQVQSEIVISLLRNVRESVKAANPDTRLDLFAPASPDAGGGLTYEALSELADGALTGYVSSDEAAREATRQVQSVMVDRPVNGMVRALHPNTTDPSEIQPRVAAFRESGASGVNFYNYGLMSLPMLDAVGEALAGD